MPAPLPLVSPATLKAYAASSGTTPGPASLPDYEEDGTDMSQVGIALRAAERIGASYLRRTALRTVLRDDDLTVYPFEALDPAGADRGRYAWPEYGPVSEVVTPASVTTDGEKILVPDSVDGIGTVGRFTYYAGWREESEDLATVQSYDGLSGVTVLPDAAPPEVVAAISETALFMIGRIRGGHVGQTGKEINTGQVVQVIRGFAVTTPEIAAIWGTYCAHLRPVLA